MNIHCSLEVTVKVLRISLTTYSNKMAYNGKALRSAGHLENVQPGTEAD